MVVAAHVLKKKQKNKNGGVVMIGAGAVAKREVLGMGQRQGYGSYPACIRP